MKTALFLLLTLIGCNSSSDPIEEEEELTCTSWYDSCSCAYVCGTPEQKEDNLQMTCDVVCDTASMESVPGGSCGDVDGTCEWVEG